MGHRIVFLDYLRIISFSSVLIGHIYYSTLTAFAANPTLHASLRLLITAVVLPIAEAGGPGVILFFLISGYIISEVLRKETAKTFCIRRLFRIYPLYVTAIVVELLIKASHGAPFPPPGLLAPRLLLLGDFLGCPPALGSVEWTLRAEILFYLFMTVAKASGLYDLKRAFFGVCLLATFGMIAAYPFPRVGAVGYTFLFMPFLFAGSAFNLFRHRELPGLWTMAFLLYVLLTFLFLYPIDHGPLSTMHFPLVGVGLFVAFYWLGGKMAYDPAVALVAELTYSIYLFHNFFLAEINTRLKGAGHPPGLAVFLLFIAFCAGLHYLIEKPAIRLGKRLSNRFASPLS